MSKAVLHGVEEHVAALHALLQANIRVLKAVSRAGCLKFPMGIMLR